MLQGLKSIYYFSMEIFKTIAVHQHTLLATGRIFFKKAKVRAIQYFYWLCKNEEAIKQITQTIIVLTVAIIIVRIGASYLSHIDLPSEL